MQAVDGISTLSSGSGSLSLADTARPVSQLDIQYPKYYDFLCFAISPYTIHMGPRQMYKIAAVAMSLQMPCPQQAARRLGSIPPSPSLFNSSPATLHPSVAMSIGAITFKYQPSPSQLQFYLFFFFLHLV